MQRIRFLGLAVSSCAAALLAVFLTRGEGGGYEYIPPARSFVVVECPASVSDREVVGALRGNGIQGVLSESTQFFLLSAWNGVEQVPLDMLDERLLDSDPRRDVYAQNVRAFFVNEKTRRFFVPLSNWTNENAQVIEAAVRDALSRFPVSSVIMLRIHNPQSPLSQIFGIIGKTAVWTAILMICGLFIPSFFKDFLVNRAYRLSNHDRNIRLRKAPVAASLFLAAVFITSGMVGGAASGSRLLRIVFPLALFLIGWTLPVWVRWRAAKRRGHIQFRPVVIRETKPHSERNRPPAIIVCLLVAGALSLAASFFSGSNGLDSDGGVAAFSNEGYDELISEDDYRAHVRRQTAFSYLPLGIDREEDAPPYRRYAEDTDGLYVAAGTVEMDMETMESLVPAYPFDSLAAFIEGSGGPPDTIPVPNTASGLPEGVSLFFIVLAALLPFVILDEWGLAG
jgi:hypothetical protein